MHIPTATYRIQFNPLFGFREGKRIIPYLAALGISDLYASPIFKVRAGSMHGYDVVDPNRLNPELGDEKAFESLAAELKKNSMSWLQDIVPNHMAYDSQNEMLMDVLENRERSPFYHFFDIDWNHFYESLKGRVLAPFLGKFYAESLEDAEIQLRYDEIGLGITYYSLRLPLRLESYARVFAHNIQALEERIGKGHPDLLKLLGSLHLLESLASPPEKNSEYDQVRHAKGMLWEIYTGNQAIRGFMDANIRLFNGEKGKPESFTLIDDLLAEQPYRLSFWKVAAEEINYRRFFNINALISLRVEDEAVFSHTHELIFRLVREGTFDGLRIDHIDGLCDPATYLERIKEQANHLYLVVEKILDFDETLPPPWPVQGTTGYDFMNQVNGVFCQKDHQREFIKIYYRFTGLKASYQELVSEKKRLIIGKHMAGNIDNLAHIMKRIAGRDRYGRDITLYALKRALVEVMSFFPVYRSYINQRSFTESDKVHIDKAIQDARRRNPDLFYEMNYIEKFFSLDFPDHLTEEEKEHLMHFIMRFQQFTGPLMAKGFEDTVLYIYNRLISLNDVGGDPQRFGVTGEEFHRFNTARATTLPHSLNATSTHDTKRGEDVRARINVLSEIPFEWETHLRHWARINRRKKKKGNGVSMPDENDEYFLYQTLLGVFPFGEPDMESLTERVREYMIKAVREAKRHTAWIKPDTEYEEACTGFVERLLSAADDNLFLKEFLPFQRKVAFYGIFNSLSQTLLKITSPGVPDFYQGTELWDLSLVDPDNRRPIDFKKRMHILKDINAREARDLPGLVDELVETREDGRIKLFLVYRVLKARTRLLDAFQHGAYIPIRVEGAHAESVIAFARNHQDAWAISVAPRFLTSLIKEGQCPSGEEVWQDTRLLMPEGAPSSWINAITGERISHHGPIPLGAILTRFPVALLTSIKG
ncbi:MAG: malto-oligosyltrehalose synthase [bacterium]